MSSPLSLQRISSPRGRAILSRFSSRLTRLRETLERKKIHGFLVTNITNIRYLSGFRGSSGFIFITKNKNIFITDFRYKEQAERELSGWDISIEKSDRFRIIKKFVSCLGVKTLGFESDVSYDFFKRLSLCGAGIKPLRGIVEDQRSIKDNEEVYSIKEAIRRAEAALLDVKPYIREWKRERQIALMLEERLKKRGCNHLPFDIIVASGINSALPHARASDKKLYPGDLVVVDWGGEAGGYYSDITRSFLIKDSRSPKGPKTFLERSNIAKKREIYQLVLKANRSATSSILPDIEGRAIDSAARDIIKDEGYGKFFGHGTGHGVGLEVHELPRISWAKSDTVKENMVFTIEPGIYIPGLGGVRIEDMILVKSRGAEVLTKLPRHLEII